MVMLDVVILGGGPHALTLASLLRNTESDPNSDRRHDSHHPPSPDNPAGPRADPETSTSNKERCVGRKSGRATAGPTPPEQPAKSTKSERLDFPPMSLRVVDSYGAWTSLWESQFTALNIPHLRSHTLVHTDPLNKKALQEFVLKSDRSAELHSLPDQVYILDENAFFNDMRLGKKERKRLNITSTLRKSLSFSLPGTKLSVDFFKDQVERYNLDKVLLKGTVERITPVMEDRADFIREGEVTRVNEGKRVKYFQVLLQEGVLLKARQVVMATGPTRAHMANIPSWVKSIAESFPEERLQHTVHLMHRLPAARQTLKATDSPSSRLNEASPTQARRQPCDVGHEEAPPAEAVRRGRRGEPGGSVLSRGARHQDGRPGLPQAVLQRAQPPQAAGYDSPGEERRRRHAGGLRPPAAVHPEWTGGREDVLSGE